MGALRTFRLRDANTGDSVDTAAPAVIAFVSRAGVARTPPASCVNIGGGLYGVVFSTADVDAGTAALVESGPDLTPAHVSMSVWLPTEPFHAMHFENLDGSLWGGDSPSVPLYQSQAAVALTPPALTPLTAPYFYGLAPTAADLALGVAYLVTGAPGSLGTYDGSFFYGEPSGGTLGEIVYAALSGDPTVASLVGTDIFPNVRPPAAALPVVVYSVISDVPENTLDGSAHSRLRHARLQLDSYGRTYKEAHQVADAVNEVLGNLPGGADAPAGWLDSERDLYDNTTQTHRVSSDYIISR